MYNMGLLLLVFLLSALASALPSLQMCLEQSFNPDGSPGPCTLWRDAVAGNATVSVAAPAASRSTKASEPGPGPGPGPASNSQHQRPQQSSHADGSSGACTSWRDDDGGSYTESVWETESSTLKPCTGSNGPNTRHCWTSGFDINTDFDKDWPSTGVTRKYNFDITNGTAAPDGTPRITFLINGQYQGPTIHADWGDFVEITVTNNMQDNGTGIHWHGVRQYNTNFEDGVPGITECPLAPGQTKLYRWHATQYGTSWYHSHSGTQYGDGVVGALVINGPSTANYDIDLGVLPVTDWYYETASTRSYVVAHTSGVPPTMADNGLINSTMVSKQGTGKYAVTNLERGKKYKLRLVNTAVDNHFMVSLDNHPFQVVASDFVPIKPYTAEWIFIAIGQRYDVIITANRECGNYWFRAEVQDQAGPNCGLNANNGNIKSIFRYRGAPSMHPTSQSTSYTQRCSDEVVVPYWDSRVPSEPLTKGNQLDTAINVGVNSEGSTVVKWGINKTAMSVKWDKPVLQQVLRNQFNVSKAENLINLPNAGEWYYWAIQEVAGEPFSIDTPHPIHLHGHSFYVLGQGVGSFSDTGGSTLNYANPVRRDTAMLPAGGWVVVAFKTDNPGAWLMHCHIAWHQSEGMSVAFLESASKIKSINSPANSLTETCNQWNAYYPKHAAYLRDADDSGI